MNILHYTIGMPGERNGGSVIYAHGLMKAQLRQGDRVYALTCGDTLFRSRTVKIRPRGESEGIRLYRLTNPLTPTLIYGTRCPASQCRPLRIDRDNITRFVRSNDIQQFYIHTFMGLHKDVTALIRSLGVRIIYVTHDFHGLCPRYCFIDSAGELCDTPSAEKCAACCRREPSDLFLRMANSPLYRRLRDSGLLPRRNPPFPAKAAASASSPSAGQKTEKASPLLVGEYGRLLEYYREYFRLIDSFSFNSAQTAGIFRRFLGDIPGDVAVPVSEGFVGHTLPPRKPDGVLRLGYIGSTADYKGFPMLRDLLCELYREGTRNISLTVYGGTRRATDPECPMIEYRPAYTREQLPEVYAQLDMTVVPSKWHETFSLVVLESLSFGRPAIVSDRVGAKDLVAARFPGLVFSTREGLARLLRNLANPS